MAILGHREVGLSKQPGAGPVALRADHAWTCGATALILSALICHSNTPFSQTIHQAGWRHWSGRSGQRDPRSDSAGSNLESCAAVSLSHPGILHPLPHFRYRGHRYDYRARMKNGEDRAPEPAAQPEFGHRLHRTRIERARLSVLLVFLFFFLFILSIDQGHSFYLAGARTAPSLPCLQP